MACVRFQDVGIGTQALSALMGPEAWHMFFPGSVNGDDVIPYQVRSLLLTQLMNLKATLEGSAHEEARKAGNEALKSSRKVVKKNTKRLQRAKRQALREGAADEAEDSISDLDL